MYLAVLCQIKCVNVDAYYDTWPLPSGLVTGFCGPGPDAKSAH